MGTYAVVEDGIIINLISSEDKDTAESVSGKECVEYTEPFDAVMTSPLVGWSVVEGVIINPDAPAPDESEPVIDESEEII
jgi:hypothetical protein